MSRAGVLLGMSRRLRCVPTRPFNNHEVNYRAMLQLLPRSALARCRRRGRQPLLATGCSLPLLKPAFYGTSKVCTRTLPRICRNMLENVLILIMLASSARLA